MLLFAFSLCVIPCCAAAESASPGADPPAAGSASPFLAPGEPPVVTEWDYVSENVAIHITPIRYEIPLSETNIRKTDVFVADIWVKDVSSFCRAYAGEGWGKARLKIDEFAEQFGAILAISGDSATELRGGVVVFNSTVVRNGPFLADDPRDVGILYTNGEFVTILAQKVDKAEILAQLERGEIWQIFFFGPRLLDDEGHAMEKFNSKVKPANPRSAIGYYEPGHYCFVQVDGRSTKSKLEEKGKNNGLRIELLSKLMEELGCKAAYNLDGGKTSQLYFNGEVVSTPENGGRKLADIVLIREPPAPENRQTTTKNKQPLAAGGTTDN